MGFKKIDDFIQEADLKKNAVPKREKGRKKRSETYLAVYLSKEEKERVNRYAEEQGISVSALIRLLLKKEGIL
jgi:molybdopterin-guanine dinucleotide biosynthesis protein A